MSREHNNERFRILWIANKPWCNTRRFIANARWPLNAMTETEKLIDRIEEMARRAGAKFVIDPDKLAAFIAARKRS